MLKLKNIIRSVFLFVLFCTLVFSQQSQLQRAAALFESGKYEEAGKIFESLINAGGATKEVYGGAIECAIKLNQNKKAIELALQAVERFGSDYNYELLVAQLHNKSGNNTASINTLERMVKRYPDSTSLKISLSELYLIHAGELYNNGKPDDAAAAIVTSLKYNSRNLEARKNLIIIYLQQKKYQEALPHAKEAYRASPRDKTIQQLYFEVLIGTENFEEAVKVSEQLSKESPDDVKIQLNTALLYRYSGQPEKAYLKYAELRQKFPRSKEVYKADIELLELNSFNDTVVSRYKEFLALTPDDLEMSVGLGKTYEKMKLFDSARTVYSSLVERDINRDAQLLIAETYAKENDFVNAIDVYKKYILSGGKNPMAFARVSELLAKNNRTDESRGFLLQAVNVHPARTDFFVALAKSYYYDNKPDSALVWLDKVKSNFIEYPEISYLLGRIHLDNKDTSRAIFQLTRSIRYSIEQSRQIQVRILGAVSGNNVNNPDSAQVAKEKGAELDSVSTILKDSFRRLKELMSREQYLASLRKFIIDIPHSALLYLQRAKLLQEMGMAEDAGKDYETALALSPSSDEVQSSVGEYYESIGNDEKALTAFRRASSLNKKEAYYYRKIIDLASKEGKLNEVCDFWLKLYETDKSNAVLREHLIEALHKAGRFEEADSIIKNYELRIKN